MLGSLNSRILGAASSSARLARAFMRAALGNVAFLRKRFLLLIAWPIGALILALAGWAALHAHIGRERAVAEMGAVTDTVALARNHARHVARTVDAIDQMVLHTRFEWLQSGARLQLDKLTALHMLSPSMSFNVMIADQHGTVVSSAIAGTSGARKSVAERSFFQRLKSGRDDVLDIGAPEISVFMARRVIFFSRRIAAPDGRFMGTVTVAVLPRYFSGVYDEVTLKRHGLIGVLGEDLVARALRVGSASEEQGGLVSVSVPRLDLAGGSMLLDGTRFPDRRNRYIAWHPAAPYPLLALVGLDQREALSGFAASQAAQIEYATWATWGLAGFTLIAMALSYGLARRKHEFESAQATYRVATEGGDEGFFIVRPTEPGRARDFVIIDCNRSGAEFLRQRREGLSGKAISDLFADSDPDLWIGMLNDAMQGGSTLLEVNIPSGSTLAMRWARVKCVRVGNSLAMTLQDTSETKAHVNELERRSNEDVLTGLPNRQWLQSYLPKAVAHAAAAGELLAVLFIDLDGFKAVNDSVGHAVGDELLRNAAARLNDAVRPRDHVVRLGGDEFLVVLEQIENPNAAAQVAQRILRAFQEKFRLSKGIHAVGTSIGVSMFPADGQDAETLLRHADVAMYAVKNGGKNNVDFYDQQFHDAMLSRLEMERQLRHAIEHDQLLVYYQPRVDMHSGLTCGMEALVRWQHPQRGLVEPIEFISLAEQTGLILELGTVVIDKVCAQLQAWARSGAPLLPVSINISPRQFDELDVAQILRDAIERYQLAPELIEIELTESSMMGGSEGGSEAASASVAAIRSLGIKMLVDDFGTGYSSLSQLQRLDFDVLKVDQSFTTQIDWNKSGSVFIKAIVTMAHALGMRVVAEGVETARQVSVLKALDCDEMQGFYLSRPLAPTSTQPCLQPFDFQADPGPPGQYADP